MKLKKMCMRYLALSVLFATTVWPLSACANIVGLTNNATWGEYRLKINETAFDTNTNTWNNATNAAVGAVNHTAITNLTSEITVASGLVSIASDGGNTDFVFGSTQLGDTFNSIHDSRMWFDKSKSAFRAGIVTGDKWDDANVGTYSASFGEGTTASGSRSSALGSGTTASGYASTALGNYTTASGSDSASFGGNTTASGEASAALGNTTTASGFASASFGEGTTASGYTAAAFGFTTTASGDYSASFGNTTTASGDFSAAFGFTTKAESYASFAAGRYNVGGGTAGSWVATDPLFEIGMGTSPSAKANAFTVYKNGNAAVAGVLTLGGDPSADLDAMSKGYADANYSDASDITAASNGLTTAFIAADVVVSSAYGSADTVVSNGLTTAFVAADTTASNGLTTAYTSADNVVSNALAAEIASIGGVSESDLTAVSNAFIAADATLSASLIAGYEAADAAVVSGYQSADSSQSSTLTAAYVAADAVVTAAYIAADTVISNALAGTSATVPISPYDLLFAFTFDGVLTNNWWGSVVGTNNSAAQAFDSTPGGYVDLVDGSGTARYFDAPVVTADNTHTLFFRFKGEENAGSTAYLFVQDEGTPSYYAYYPDAENTLYFSYNGSSGTGSCSHGDWHTFAVVVSAGGMQSYLDGETFSSNATALTFTDTIAVGNNDSTTVGDLQVASFYMWDRSLSADEVSRLHALEITGQYGVQGLRKP